MEEIQPETKLTKILTTAENVVIIDKLFGPLVCCQVRISIDYNTKEWVIEREVLTLVGDDYFERVCSFGVQSSIEFE